MRAKPGAQRENRPGDGRKGEKLGSANARARKSSGREAELQPLQQQLLLTLIISIIIRRSSTLVGGRSSSSVATK